MNHKKQKYNKHGSADLATYSDDDNFSRRRIAFTLTTGRINTPKFRHEAFTDLKRILRKYSTNWIYSFNMETLDKDLMDTMIHLHGTINYPVTEQRNVMRFISNWERARGYVYWEYLKANPKDLFSWHYTYCRKELQYHKKPHKYWINKINWHNVRKIKKICNPIMSCFCQNPQRSED